MDDSERKALRDESRLVVAFLLLPVVNVSVAFVGALIIQWVFDLGWADPLDAAVAFTMAVGIAAVLVTGVCALPIVLAFIAWGPVSFRQLVIAGAVLGNVPYALGTLLAFVNLGRGPLSPGPGQETFGIQRVMMAIALGSLMGVQSAATLWIVGIRGTGYARRLGDSP